MKERYKQSRHVVQGLDFKKVRPGLLVAECWCKRQPVWVTPKDVRDGITASCGHKECRPS